MAPPVLPAPKVKRGDGNVTKESGSSSDSFKIPLMPVSDVVSGRILFNQSFNHYTCVCSYSREVV